MSVAANNHRSLKKVIISEPEIKDKNKESMTPIMICAVTPTRIYLLDWEGYHERGAGPSRILFEFDRNKATKIKCHIHNFIHHTVDIHHQHEHGHHAKVECKLGALHHNKKMNKEVIDLLKEHRY